MFRKLYTDYIKPTQLDEDLRNRELVLNVLLVGTLLVELLALCILLVSYFAWGNHYVDARILIFIVVLAVTAGTYGLSRSRQHYIASLILLSIYALFAVGASLAWGVTMPVTVALYALLIILSAILLGAKYSLYSTAFVIGTVSVLQVHQNAGTLRPDLSWTHSALDYGIVMGFCIIFVVVGLVTWLFNVRMEHSLARAQRAELNLKRQRDLLETTVEERTRELQAVQFERLQQLYRFAELGKISTALLHELAGHLTSLSLDIEGLESQEHSQVLKRAKRSIRYIDDMLLKVRDQLQGKSVVRPFNVATETEEVVGILKHRAARNAVTLQLEATGDRKQLRVRGESVRFRQLIANIISNAIDAYDELDVADPKQVVIHIREQDDQLTIAVSDWGKGIPASERAKLFEPFYSTKEVGMGMGLSIARQIAEKHFSGTLYLDNITEYTSFVLKLPKA